ncbi:MAG: Fic family protein [Synergistaceae bacterium]|nr:Fic family protein [Synergistaceae bacterium]
MMKIPVSERELESNYDVVMAEIDRLSLERVNLIWDSWPEFVGMAGTWKCLRRIHAELFGGLFEFAGTIRNVNISKGGFRFTNSLFLEKILPVISDMPQKNFDDIIAKYIEMNIAHPFREGNGRAMRLWLDSILERELNTRVDWRKIGREEYMSAMQRSPVNPLELSVLLKGSMLKGDELSDKVIFAKGLAVSYSYERF